MPRELKIPTREMGELKLYLIYEKDGTWESEWTALQATSLAAIVTVVSQETMDHALRGYTSPLIKQLGLASDLAIRKLPLINQVCSERATCRLYDKRSCVPTHKNMPWCYQPDGIEDAEARKLAGAAISLWREGNYIIVVRE